MISKTAVASEKIDKTNSDSDAAGPAAPQHGSPPTLLSAGTQREVDQARQRIRHFEGKIAAVETKIGAFQQSLTQAIVHGTFTFRPRDIDRAIGKLHEDKKELEFRRDDWQLMLNGALIRLEAEQRRIGGPSAADAAVPDNGAPGSVSEAKHAPQAPAISGLNYVSEVKIAIGFILSLNGDASDLQICRRFDAEGIVELPQRWTTAENRSFERAYKDPQHRHKIEKLISRVRSDMRKKRSAELS
jgi:hypothetical protein